MRTGKINYNVTEFYDSLTRTYISVIIFPAGLLPAGTNNFTSRTSYIYDIIAKADDVVVQVVNSNIQWVCYLLVLTIRPITTSTDLHFQQTGLLYNYKFHRSQWVCHPLVQTF